MLLKIHNVLLLNANQLLNLYLPTKCTRISNQTKYVWKPSCLMIVCKIQGSGTFVHSRTRKPKIRCIQTWTWDVSMTKHIKSSATLFFDIPSCRLQHPVYLSLSKFPRPYFRINQPAYYNQFTQWRRIIWKWESCKRLRNYDLDVKCTCGTYLLKLI